MTMVDTIIFLNMLRIVSQSVVSVIQFVLDIVLLRLVLFGSETRGVSHGGLAIDIKKVS
jgi:hypothetical protein